MCDVEGCNFFLTASIDDGEKRIELCPNHQLGYAIEEIPQYSLEFHISQYDGKEQCDICKENGAIRFQDHDFTTQLCQSHLNKLMRKDLEPSEYKVLVGLYGNEVFLLHDDFYTEDGIAINPFTVYRYAQLIILNVRFFPFREVTPL